MWCMSGSTIVMTVPITSCPELRPSDYWIVSAEECSSLMQNLMQISCSTCSVILNVMATQCTCALDGIYLPHWLVHWSHRSRTHIPVHSPWPPGYIINITQTVLIILTMAGLFLDRPHIFWNMVNTKIIFYWIINLVPPELTACLEPQSWQYFMFPSHPNSKCLGFAWCLICLDAIFES